MSVPKRHIDIDGDMPVREFFRLLDIPGDSVTMLVEGEPVLVEVHTHEADHEELTPAEKWERSKRAMEELRKYVDLDELERNIYSDRENEPIRPPVILE